MGDFKSVNNSAANLFRCGHVQQIQVAHEKSDTLFVRADCLPEMKIKLKLNKRTFDICGATCDCPAGKGTKTSCKHIAATCYALEEFQGLGYFRHSRRALTDSRLGINRDLKNWIQCRLKISASVNTN